MVLYWSDSLPDSSSTLLHESRICSSGKKSRLGSPPANEMTSGWMVTFNISRMNDFGTSLILSENIFSITFTSRSHYFHLKPVSIKILWFVNHIIMLTAIKFMNTVTFHYNVTAPATERPRYHNHFFRMEHDEENKNSLHSRSRHR